MSDPFSGAVSQLLEEAGGSIPFNLPEQSIYLESVRGLRSELDDIISGTITIAPSTIDHDALLNFDQNEHYLQSAIVEVGTVATGTWNADVITEVYGGTGQSSYTLGDVLYSDGANSLGKLSGNTTATKKFLTQIGDGAISAAPVWNRISSVDVDMAKVGNPTFTTVQHIQDVFHSSGWISGGVLSDDGSQNIDVTAGEGLLRATDSRIATLLFSAWSTSNTNAISDGTAKFVGVEYNAGTPQIVVKATDTWDFNTDFPIGSVVREGTTLHISQTEHDIGDHANFMIQRMFEVQKFARDNNTGGLILGEDGANRFVTTSAGAVWERLNRFSISAIDTDTGGAADTFETYKHVSGTFTLTTGVSVWPNAQYDDGTDLVTMTNNRYANLWFYLDIDGDLVMLYGTAQYTSSSLAELESPPTTVPLRISTHSFLIGRMIFQKSASSTDEINSIFSTVFSPTLVSDHGNLAGLTDDDHTQYTLASGTRAFSGNISHGNFNITNVATITATSLVGALTGNASTATALETGRTINGTSFDGTANITITAAAGTLTGTTLNSTVVSSSLTSLGTQAQALNMGTNNITNAGTGTFSGAVSMGALTATTATFSGLITAQAHIVRGTTNSGIVFSGGSTVSLGANVVLLGESHSTQANDIEFRTATVDRLVWDDSESIWNFKGNALSTGNIIIGNNAGLVIGHSAQLTIAGQLNEFQFLGSGGADSRGTIARFSNNINSAQFQFLKSRASIGSVSTVVSGDFLGVLTFLGDDGTDYATSGAAIHVITEGTIGSNRIPARMVFLTGTDVSPTVLIAALTLDSSQNATFAGTTTFNTIEYTWPASDGGSGDILETNGSGGLSWTAGGGGSLGGTGTAGTVAKWSASSTLTDSIMTESGTTLTVVNTIVATTFTGALGGNATTATTLETARDINGVSFNGGSNITVTADANTLTNTILKSTVVSSSLTSVGTLTSLDMGGDIDMNGNEITAGAGAFFTQVTASTGLIQGTATSFMILSGGSGITQGATLVLYGQTHATQAKDWEFRSDTTIKLSWDDSASLMKLTGEFQLVGNFNHDGANLAFFAHSLNTKQTITGLRADPEAALKNLLTALDSYGLILDSST